MSRLARVAAVLGLAVLITSPARASDGPLERAAGSWLALLDAGRFDDAWNQGAELLRSSESRSEWEDATRRLRESMGAVASREAVTKDYHQDLNGVPGIFFTLRFRTRLEDGREVVEVVTLTPDASQQYRAVAYGLKQ